MTRKAPSGARHASCLDHIEYGAATKSGWLCITTNTENVAWPPLEIPRPDAGAEGPFIPRGVVGRDMQPVDRAADMRAFADHIATVAAAAHARELARRDIANDPQGGWFHTTDAKTGKAGRSAPPKQYGGHIAPRAADTAAINALAAELDARKGRAVKVAAMVAAIRAEPLTEAPVETARKARVAARKVAPVKVAEPVQVVIADTVVAETRHVDIAPEPEPCHYTAPPLNEACIAGPMGHKGAHQYPTVRPCDFYLHTVGVEPIRCTAGLVGHDGEHDYPAPVVVPEPVVEPIAPAAPALAAVQPVTRPTCPRCGQVFRMKGAGLAWHLANRPDCAPARLSVAS